VDGHLYIVQPGIQPQRLMRLKLGGSGSAVESVAPMAVAITEFDGPDIGTVRDDALYYFANSNAEESPDGLLVMRTELEAGKTIVPPDVRKFNERVKKNKP
jgi:hypothetical protein